MANGQYQLSTSWEIASTRVRVKPGSLWVISGLLRIFFNIEFSILTRVTELIWLARGTRHALQALLSSCTEGCKNLPAEFRESPSKCFTAHSPPQKWTMAQFFSQPFPKPAQNDSNTPKFSTVFLLPFPLADFFNLLNFESRRSWWLHPWDHVW